MEYESQQQLQSLSTVALARCAQCNSLQFDIAIFRPKAAQDRISQSTCTQSTRGIIDNDPVANAGIVHRCSVFFLRPSSDILSKFRRVLNLENERKIGDGRFSQCDGHLLCQCLCYGLLSQRRHHAISGIVGMEAIVSQILFHHAVVIHHGAKIIQIDDVVLGAVIL